MSTTRRAEAHRGDVVEVSGRRVGDPGRMGELLEVFSAPEHPHYLVRWEDGHESVLYPGEGTTIRARGDVAAPFVGLRGSLLDQEGASLVAVREMPPEDEVRDDEELERKATPYAALYEHWERHQWSSLALDLTTDAASFRALSQSERDGLVWIFANRFHAEFNVARLLAPFLLAAPDYGMQLLLATQVADEHRHLQTVLRIYEEVFGVRGGIDAVRELADRNLDPVSRTLLYDKLEQWTLPLLERQDEDTFVQAVFVYHVLGEGVIARTGQNLAAGQYAKLSGFPGLSRGQRLVSRDEARHIGIGVSYLRRRMEADPERTRALVGAVMDDMFVVAEQMLETANSGMTDLVVSGYGVDPQGFYAEVMRLVDLRLRSIGFIEG